jgi:predicted dehydrogenase
MRHAVVRGEIGKIVSVRTTFCAPRRWATSWRRLRHQGSGALLEFASHSIDLIHFVVGEPISEVSAQICSRESEDDTAHIQGRTDSGIGVHGFFSFCAVEEAGMEVYGDGGKLTLDQYGRLTLDRRGVAARGPFRTTLAALAQWRDVRCLLRRWRSPWREPSFEIALSRFIGAVRAGTPASPDLNDGLLSLRVIEAAELAARNGRIERVAAPATSSDKPRIRMELAAGAKRHG